MGKRTSGSQFFHISLMICEKEVGGQQREGGGRSEVKTHFRQLSLALPHPYAKRGSEGEESVLITKRRTQETSRLTRVVLLNLAKLCDAKEQPCVDGSWRTIGRTTRRRRAPTPLSRGRRGVRRGRRRRDGGSDLFCGGREHRRVRVRRFLLKGGLRRKGWIGGRGVDGWLGRGIGGECGKGRFRGSEEMEEECAHTERRTSFPSATRRATRSCIRLRRDGMLARKLRRERL